MRTLTVREREQIPVDGGAKGLTEAEADELARRAPKGALTRGYRAVDVGPFCGVLRAGGLVVEALPKIGVESAEDAQARGVLIAMLRASGDLADPDIVSAPLAVQKLHLLDVFILDFCDRVNRLLRRGHIRSYQLFEEELPTVRGRLRLAEHLRRSATNRSRIYCRFDEFTADNPHNRALKAVLVRLQQLALGPEAKSALTVLLRRMEEVAPAPCKATDIDGLSFNRLTDAWRPVFDRAAWFLRGLYPDVRAGAVDGACLMFNMERLFEAFIGVRLRRSWHSSKAVGTRIVLQGPQEYLAFAGTSPVFKLIPDASVVLADRSVHRIFDTKWKRLDPKATDVGVAAGDVYQLVNYAGRYECPTVALLYPRSEGLADGLVKTFRFRLPGEPRIEIFALDLLALATGGALPKGLGP